jgi:hypothetical protein
MKQYRTTSVKRAVREYAHRHNLHEDCLSIEVEPQGKGSAWGSITVTSKDGYSFFRQEPTDAEPTPMRYHRLVILTDRRGVEHQTPAHIYRAITTSLDRNVWRIEQCPAGCSCGKAFADRPEVIRDKERTAMFDLFDKKEMKKDLLAAANRFEAARRELENAAREYDEAVQRLPGLDRDDREEHQVSDALRELPRPMWNVNHLVHVAIDGVVNDALPCLRRGRDVYDYRDPRGSLTQEQRAEVARLMVEANATTEEHRRVIVERYIDPEACPDFEEPTNADDVAGVA